MFPSHCDDPQKHCQNKGRDPLRKGVRIENEVLDGLHCRWIERIGRETRAYCEAVSH
jgi:hypothetical protein